MHPLTWLEDFLDLEMTWLLEYCASSDDLLHDLSDLEMSWLS